MENLRIEGVVIIEDSFACDGERLLASTSAYACSKKEFREVRVVLLDTWKTTFEKRYPRLKDLGVIVDEAESVASFEDSFRGIKVPAAFFIDHVGGDQQGSSIEEICRSLKSLTKYGAVVARVFSEEFTEQQRKRLHAIADVLLVLSVTAGGAGLCSLRYFKKTGKRVQKKQSFTVDDSLKLSASTYTTNMDIRDEVSKTDSAAWEMPEVPFDLGLQLSENERLAKESLQLPFTAAQNPNGFEYSASGTQKVRAGGRVIYTPDEADDLDDSDPDEDLQI